MAAMDVEALIKRYERADQKRQAFAALMRDCYAYAMPERDAWSSYGYGQDRNSVMIFDSTAVVAVPRFANRLQQALFPPQQRWAQLALPPEIAEEEGAEAEKANLEAATDLMFRHIHQSNFDAAISEWGQDLAAGVGALLVENGRFGQRRTRGPLLRFEAVPSALVAFDEGPFGGVEGVFFTQRMPARLVQRKYADAKRLPPEFQRLLHDKPDDEVELLQCTYYDAKADIYRFEVLLKAEKARIVDRKYRTNPWIITRWTKAPGEIHGRGPLMQALPDIRTVNKLMELALKSGALGVGGVWTAVDDGVLNPDTIRIAPGVVIPVGSNATGGRGPSLRALEMPGNFTLNEAMQDKMKTSIRQMLFDDPLPPEVQAGLTATEVVERVRRFQADTGAFGRLQADAVTPLIARIIDILDEAGTFAAPRYAGLMKSLQDEAVRIQATSPLSQAQDRADVQSVMMLIQGMASMGELGAQLLQRAIKLDDAGRYIAIRAGVPQVLIPSEKDVAAQNQAQGEAAQTEQALTSPVVAQLAGALGNAASRAVGGEKAA
ncbi:hypothetical protein GXW78_16890 [Roseomonas terrae]|uniref:Uncharacterized protein n=1 Tax=Neoroseomonas terrae TaxID=424799 RepID=A0ABS5EK08_9PROT|nr:portal protein [Neoroseomonas terrae]MBR0651352.1 hypothetical protein [Neoroseomonas terrae]